MSMHLGDASVDGRSALDPAASARLNPDPTHYGPAFASSPPFTRRPVGSPDVTSFWKLNSLTAGYYADHAARRRTEWVARARTRTDQTGIASIFGEMRFGNARSTAIFG